MPLILFGGFPFGIMWKYEKNGCFSGRLRPDWKVPHGRLRPDWGVPHRRLRPDWGLYGIVGLPGNVLVLRPSLNLFIVWERLSNLGLMKMLPGSVTMGTMFMYPTCSGSCESSGPFGHSQIL